MYTYIIYIIYYIHYQTEDSYFGKAANLSHYKIAMPHGIIAKYYYYFVLSFSVNKSIMTNTIMHLMRERAN